MEDKKRTIYAVLIALVVVVGLLYSFGMNLFSQTPQLELPASGEMSTQKPEPGTIGTEAGITVRVEPATVQSVIARLSRYESYSRTVFVTYGWGDGESETITSQVWTDGGWARTDTQFPSGLMECSIVSDDGTWIWYLTEQETSNVFYSGANGPEADLMQHLPTYENVLELEPESITNADYVEYDGRFCIYVEAEQRELGYLYRYWISIDSGLLMAAETEKSGSIVYRMSSNEVTSPLAAQRDTFALPDGTVLYRAD